MLNKIIPTCLMMSRSNPAVSIQSTTTLNPTHFQTVTLGNLTVLISRFHTFILGMLFVNTLKCLLVLWWNFKGNNRSRAVCFENLVRCRVNAAVCV